MADPYKLPEGNVAIAFSGGRTSAFMLHEILRVNGSLPERVVVSFQNTEREMPQTLDFVQECGERAVIVEQLERKYGETRRSVGFEQGRGIVEVYASEKTGTRVSGTGWGRVLPASFIAWERRESRAAIRPGSHRDNGGTMSHYLAAIGQVDGGAAVETADDYLTEVLSAVRKTGKKGKVTIELHVAPNGDRGFEVTTKVKASAPEVEFGRSFFFADRDGHLTRTAPPEESDAILLNDRRG